MKKTTQQIHIATMKFIRGRRTRFRKKNNIIRQANQEKKKTEKANSNKKTECE